MRLALTIICLMMALSVAASADGFYWSQDFETLPLPDEWDVQSGDGGFGGVVVDPLDSNNHVLKLDSSSSGGWAYAAVSSTALDYDNPGTGVITYRLLLLTDDNYILYSPGSNTITNIIYGTGLYTNPAGPQIYTFNTNQWYNIKYIVDWENFEDYELWIDNTRIGTYDSYDAGPPGGIAFWLGNYPSGSSTINIPPIPPQGGACWDDFTITVPEPSSILAMMTGLVVLVRRRKK